MQNDCVEFLQWALPQLNLRWAGFRKVRKQVCKRIRRRMKRLELQEYGDYRDWLVDHPEEWPVLDEMCRITISRFYRDWAVFDRIKNDFLPTLAQRAASENRVLRCWSAGCASGEEPYTLSLIWHFGLLEKYSGTALRIVATDIDEHLLKRALTGCYPKGALKGLPPDWISAAFSLREGSYCILPEYAKPIEWHEEDIRTTLPPGRFDLVLCRNLVATYFQHSLQLKVFERIKTVLRPGGILVLGCHEKLPEELTGFTVRDEKLNAYERKTN